jgi:hypothetical protein
MASKISALLSYNYLTDKFAAFEQIAKTSGPPYHSVLRPRILDEEPRAASRDDARVRRLAAALRVEDRGVQHHRLPPALLLRTPRSQLSRGLGLGFAAHGGLFVFLHSAEEKGEIQTWWKARTVARERRAHISSK